MQRRNVAKRRPLQGADYAILEASVALAMLASRTLTGFLSRMQKEGELIAILAFDEWLQSLRQPGSASPDVPLIALR